MSQTKPMSTGRRILTYITQQGVSPMTARQARQADRLAKRENLLTAGVLTHGATGEQIRRPRGYARGWLALRGSIVTHTATHCAPCAEHVRPRLHRSPVAVESPSSSDPLVPASPVGD